MPAPVLQVKDLHVEFHTDDGIVRAVGGVSFGVEAGKTLGIVGESGSGKSVTNLAVMGLVPQPPGRVTGGTAHYDGRDLLRMSLADISAIRGNRLAMIFQDPMTALNPFLTIERQLSEVTQRHLGHDRSTARRHAIEMLERVGIPGASQRIDEDMLKILEGERLVELGILEFQQGKYEAASQTYRNGLETGGRSNLAPW